MSSCLPNKAAQTALARGVDLPGCLEANMDSALCNAAPVHNVQRHMKEPEQHTLALEQGSVTLKNTASLTARQ